MNSKDRRFGGGSHGSGGPHELGTKDTKAAENNHAGCDGHKRHAEAENVLHSDAMALFTTSAHRDIHCGTLVLRRIRFTFSSKPTPRRGRAH